ncbi:putative reverse transcriptase domain-containing protein [Tanacetum coccineum]
MNLEYYIALNTLQFETRANITSTEIEEETEMEMEEEMEIGIVTIMGMETMTGMREELCKLPELSLLCLKMVPEEEDKNGKQPDGSKVHANSARQAKNNRKWENHSRDNHYENYKKVGYMTRDCKTHDAATDQRDPLENQKTTVTCYECGRQGHYKSECPKLRNQNRGNQVGNNKAQGRAFALGGG